MAVEREAILKQTRDSGALDVARFCYTRGARLPRRTVVRKTSRIHRSFRTFAKDARWASFFRKQRFPAGADGSMSSNFAARERFTQAAFWWMKQELDIPPDRAMARARR
jgi:hypothetical protein